MSSDIEIFNNHQADTRNRADSLVKAILIIAGGSLSISIGIFLQEGRVPLTVHTRIILEISWWLLFLSIVSGVLTLYTIIMRDYLFGERWRKQIAGDVHVDASSKPRWMEVLILLFGHIGVICFVIGILCLAYVATTAITVG